MEQAQIEKNAKFLVEKLPGTKIKGSVKFRVKYKDLVNVAKCYGITDPKYVGSEDEIVAFPAFANAFTVKTLYSLIPAIKLEQDGVMRMVFTNPGKTLHASQEYEFIKDIRPGDKLTSTASIGKVWEKNLRLFIEFFVETKNQDGDIVIKGTAIYTTAPGGY